MLSAFQKRFVHIMNNRKFLGGLHSAFGHIARSRSGLACVARNLYFRQSNHAGQFTGIPFLGDVAGSQNASNREFLVLRRHMTHETPFLSQNERRETAGETAKPIDFV